jgi:hypothetical protein
MEKIFRMLREFESNANPGTFKIIFKESANHLWNQFTYKCDYNIVRFTRILDSENHKALMSYLDVPIQKQRKMVEFSTQS